MHSMCAQYVWNENYWDNFQMTSRWDSMFHQYFFFFTRNRKYSTKSVTVGLHFSLFKACQPLANSSIFSGEAGCFRTESAFYHWSAVFSLHFTPGVQSTVCVLRWPVSNILNAGQSEIFPEFPPKGSLKLVGNKCRVAPCNRRNRFSNSLLYYYYFVSIPKTS